MVWQESRATHRLCSAERGLSGVGPLSKQLSVVGDVAKLRITVGCLLLAVASCTRTPPTTVQQRPQVKAVMWSAAPALVGRELIAADVSLLGVRAGQFEFEVLPSCEEHPPRANLVSRMSTAGLVRFFKATDGTSRTTMDLANGRPLASELTILDGEVVRRYSAIHQPGAVETTYSRSGKEPVRKTAATPAGEHALDMQSAFLLLRHWRAEPGQQGYFYVLLGKNVWQVLVTYEGVRDLESSDGLTAHLVSGTATRVDSEGSVHERRFTMWLDRGTARVPLLVEGDASFGKVVMKLSRREVDRDRTRACLTALR